MDIGIGIKLYGFYTDNGLEFWLTIKLNRIWFRVSIVIDVIIEWNHFGFLGFLGI